MIMHGPAQVGKLNVLNLQKFRDRSCEYNLNIMGWKCGVWVCGCVGVCVCVCVYVEG